MKPLLALLGVSLAANAALFFTRPAPRPSSNTAIAANKNTTAANAATLQSSGDSTTAGTGPHAAFWQKLRTGDAATVASLRAAGWPEEAIRALVEAHVNDLFRPRFRALTPDYAKTEYWRDNLYSAGWTPAIAKSRRDLNREKSAMLRSMLGADYVPTASSQTLAQYPGLTPGQIESLQMISEDYRVLRAEVAGSMNNYNTPLLPEDTEKIAYLEKEMLADIGKLLTPEQIFELDVRNSSISTNLRFQLTAFDASEEEFRKIFAIQQAAATAAGFGSGNNSAMTMAQREALRKAQDATDPQIKEVLTPERYADYVRAKDYEYRRIYQLTERLQLPKEKALAAYAVKADIEKRTREIKPTPGPDAVKSITEARAALAKEAEQLLVEALGQRAYDAYKGSGINWINRLSPTPGPQTPVFIAR